MKKKNLFFCLFILFFLSCDQRKDIDFDIPFEGEKLVVYGIISNDFLPRVTVYKSNDILTEEPDFSVSGVSASLLSEDEITQSFVFTEDTGETAEQIDFEKSYRISVQKGEGIITSDEVIIPEIVQITDFESNIFPDSSSVSFTFSFLDPATKGNEYNYQIIKKSEGEILAASDFNRVDELDLRGSISDEDFNGQRKVFVLEEKLRFPIFEDGELIGVQVLDEIIIKLYHFSPEIIQFNASLDNNSNSLGNQFSGQNPPYSNLSGGYGYFGAVAVDSVVINL